MMTTLHDEAAERQLAGMAIGAGWSARATVARIPAADWYDISLRRAVSVAARLDDDDLPAPADAAQLLDEQRAAAVAAELGRPVSWALGLLACRRSLHDTSGALAARVVAAAGRRHHAHALLNELDALGVPVDRAVAA